MALITSGEFYRIRTIFSGVTGSPYYFSVAVQGSTASTEAIESVNEFWEEIDTYLSDGMTWEVPAECPVFSISTGDVVGFTVAGSGHTGVGVATDEQLPQSNQAKVRLRTGEYQNGRELRGAFFIPGLTQLINDWGVVASAARSNINVAAERLLGLGAFVTGGLNGAGMVYSRTHHTGALIATATTASQVSVLRSRRD